MQARVEISCVNRTRRKDPHERIRNVCGKDDDGTAWKLSQSDAINGIEHGKWDFYVTRSDRAMRVVVARYNGHKYLKAETDGVQPESLLSLPEC